MCFQHTRPCCSANPAPWLAAWFQALPVSVQKPTAQKGTAASEAKKQQACAAQEQDNQPRGGDQDTHLVTDGGNQVHFATYQF